MKLGWVNIILFCICRPLQADEEEDEEEDEPEDGDAVETDEEED